MVEEFMAASRAADRGRQVGQGQEAGGKGAKGEEEEKEYEIGIDEEDDADAPPPPPPPPPPAGGPPPAHMVGVPYVGVRRRHEWCSAAGWRHCDWCHMDRTVRLLWEQA